MVQLLILDQIVQFIITLLVSVGVIKMERAYFHGTVLSFVLCCRFFFHVTFEDLQSALKAQVGNSGTVHGKKSGADIGSGNNIDGSVDQSMALEKSTTMSANSDIIVALEVSI